MAVSLAAKRWTLEELDRLPDDRNTYELIHGELLVTPAPSDEHDTITARLSRILDPFVARNALGLIYRPRAVIQLSDSQVEPDLFVRQPQADRKATWRTAPLPILVVEVLSPSSKRHDQVQKRRFYMELGVPEYWIVDPEGGTITSVRPGREDVVFSGMITWSPAGTTETLTFQVSAAFA